MTKNSKRALVKTDATPIIFLIEISNSGICTLNALLVVAWASIASIICSMSERKNCVLLV